MAYIQKKYSELDAYIPTLEPGTYDLEVDCTGVAADQFVGYLEGWTYKGSPFCQKLLLATENNVFFNLRLNNIDSGITDCSGLFYKCISLTSIDASAFTNIIYAAGMFNSCEGLTSIDNTSAFANVADASNMFLGCSRLTSIDTSPFTQVTNASNMFSGCSKLTSIDISGFTKVTNIGEMFDSCTGLTSIVVNELISKSTNDNIYKLCISLNTIKCRGNAEEIKAALIANKATTKFPDAQITSWLERKKVEKSPIMTIDGKIPATYIGKPTDGQLIAWSEDDNAFVPSAGISLQNVYEIKKQEDFDAWADNLNNYDGKKYEHVVIYPGIYNTKKDFHLDKIGTKTIEGISNPTINFLPNGSGDRMLITRSESSAIMPRYKTELTGEYIKNITITLDESFDIDRPENLLVFGFTSCMNLYSCHFHMPYGFHFSVRGFVFCMNLQDCSYHTESEYFSDTTVGSVAFHTCETLVNCVSTARLSSFPWREQSTVVSFNSCKDLLYCQGIALSNLTTNFAGYNGSIGAFNNCKVMIGCKAASANNAEHPASFPIYGFKECKNVQLCSAYSHCKNGVFSSCYADHGSSYPVNDSYSGGFNNTENPS